MSIYSYRTGVVDTEQDLVNEIHTFLTSVIGGWTRVEVISDSASDRDYAWSSEGEDDRDTGIAGADPIVIRARGYNNYIEQHTYGTYVSSASNTFEVYNSSYTKVYTGIDAFRYWMFGNKNFICYIIEEVPGNSYVGYMGLIDSFYVPDTDPLPIANRGQTSASYYMYGDNTRCAMHSLTTSGVVYYEALDWGASVLGYDVGNRSSNIMLLPLVVRTDNSAASPDYECRGSFYGVYQANGTRLGNPAVITTTSGVFLSFKINNNNAGCLVMGPVSSGIDDFPGMYINGTTGYSP